MSYAVVVGEALVDLFESECDGELVYRPMVGGAPLNVAAGIARLGWPVELVSSVSTDALGERILTLLAETGVGTRGVVRVATPTALAMTSLRAGLPEFRFYGDPPSYSLLGPEHIDDVLIGRAGVLYCGSISLLPESSGAAARKAWSVPGPLRVLDPNVRPALLAAPDRLRAVIEEFAATADVVKLSEPDAQALFGLDAQAGASYLRALGAGAVVVTLGERGAWANVPSGVFAVGARPVNVIDTTGAGDAFMAAMMHGLLGRGLPRDVSQWRHVLQFAASAAGLACERRGGATAMPTKDTIDMRFPVD